MINENSQWVFDTTKAISSERQISLSTTIVQTLKKHRTWIQKNQLKYGAHYTKSNMSE